MFLVVKRAGGQVNPPPPPPPLNALDISGTSLNEVSVIISDFNAFTAYGTSVNIAPVSVNEEAGVITYYGVETNEVPMLIEGISPPSASSDLFFDQTRVLMDGLGILEGNNLRFSDRSKYNVKITRVGAAQPNSSTVQLFNMNTLWGGRNAGTTSATDRIIISTNEWPTLGTQDFTVEGWVYFNASSRINAVKGIIGSTNSGLGVHLTLGATTADRDKLVFSAGAGASRFSAATTTAQAPMNEWFYLAMSRVNGTLRCYFNGDFVASAADATNYGDFGFVLFNTDVVTAGTFNRNMPGYISNFRFTLGVGRYNSETTIPVPTQPFTA